MSEFGYAGKILTVDLSSGKVETTSSAEYTSQFIGGRGVAAKIFWDTAPARTRALDPENCLIFANGPVTGFFGLAGCRWTVCGKSPIHQPEAFSYGNLGGKWGMALKYAGYDALAVKGKAEKPVYIHIRDGACQVSEAAGLRGMPTFDAAEALRKTHGQEASVFVIGPAAESGVPFATALADGGASVSGGLASVAGSKNLKAVVVSGTDRPQAARPEALEKLVQRVRLLKSRTYEGKSPWAIEGLSRRESCYGCGLGCTRHSYPGEKGRRHKSFCQASGVYTKAAINYFGGWNKVQLLATQLCDAYGLDTGVMDPMISWLRDCFKEELLTERDTGLPLARIGSPEFIQTLVRTVSYRDGFGAVLARGTLQAASTVGPQAEKIACRYVVSPTNENRGYDPRMIPTVALLYATEPRMPIQQLHSLSGNTLINWVNHARGLPGGFLTAEDLREIARRFWGGTMAADFSTIEGKALAAKTAQDRVYVQESLLLCDVHWPAMMTSAESSDRVGDPALESQVYAAITGRDLDPAELLKVGERIFNLQRAIQLREGWGGREGDRILDYYFSEPLKRGEVFFNPEGIMPGKDGETISKIGAVLDRAEFEKMKDDYYTLRGWSVATGYPTRARLAELGLGDMMVDSLDSA